MKKKIEPTGRSKKTANELNVQKNQSNIDSGNNQRVKHTNSQCCILETTTFK